MNKVCLLLICLLFPFNARTAAAQSGSAVDPAVTKRPLTVDDLFRFRQVGAPRVSPDGTSAVYAVKEITDPAQNKSISRLWIAPTDGSAAPRLLTNSTVRDAEPQWSPDGNWILFESNRSGSGQLWVISPTGGEATQLTTISTEASHGCWSPDGKRIAFVSAVCPEFSERPFRESDAENRKKTLAIADSPVKARVFRRLFYRHWDSYVEDRRQHLFVAEVTADSRGGLTVGEPRDVTPGDRDAFPTSSTFSASVDFCFSPDSSHLIFTAVPAVDEAWSTNFDLCRVPVTGGNTEWSTLTTENPAADGLPVFSPNGRQMAYRSQRRPGCEADKWEIMLVSCTSDGRFAEPPVSLTAQLDLSFDEIVWADDQQLLVTAESQAAKPLFRLDVGRPNSVTPIHAVGTITNLSISRDGQVLLSNFARLTKPPDVICLYTRDAETAGGAVPLVRNLSLANELLLKELLLPEAESVIVAGADQDPMQMWILKPPGFDPQQKWPLGFLVHGGPQGAWSDNWSFRWNPQVWAAQGYVIAAPNPRGSAGFGQRYTDQISGDWGGRCHTDLMLGLNWLEQQPYVDTARMFGAGASFGGYMMNWFQGNTTKFRTLVTHCGVYNFDSMYATTEELWFDEHEHGGPPWGPDRSSYERHSPHRLAANFRTPMLVIHNDLDFRVPVSEGHQLFTTLQRLRIPSRFINFPDEGHWVLKPANSRYWHNEIFAWLKEYCPPGAR